MKSKSKFNNNIEPVKEVEVLETTIKYLAHLRDFLPFVILKDSCSGAMACLYPLRNYFNSIS